MPLSERARVEVYLPDLPAQAYRDLLEDFEREFTYAFGGCTIIRGLSGSYLSSVGLAISDRVSLIYTDTPFTFEPNSTTLSVYVDRLRLAAYRALDEEAILVAVLKVFHSV